MTYFAENHDDYISNNPLTLLQKGIIKSTLICMQRNRKGKFK